VDLTSDDVQDILQLLDGLPFGEMHLQTTRFSLWLRRTADGDWTQELRVLSEPAMVPAVGAASAEEAPGTQGPGTQGPGTQEQDGLRAVRAPLPGTFYRAPMPGAPPFVEAGSRVEPDTVVGIVETMKLMNSVAAGVSGTVAEILVANAEFAERDAVLIWIQEDR
jgi:acetyl-CoA carboxylase biotin carboxyl carrier protein